MTEDERRRVEAHIEQVAESLRTPGEWQYSEPLFRRYLGDSQHFRWRDLPAHEQIAYASLLGAAVQSCDQVECDPENTAQVALDAVRPLLAQPADAEDH